MSVAPFIPITRPLLGEAEMRAVQRPLEAGWLVQGPQVQEFERRFSEYTGARFAVATTSCTTALHLAMVALHLKPGDEVIVPAFTWVSTANVVEYTGATPVFCDIDLETFNIDARWIEALITPRTVGIIPVHLFGLCADMDPILEIAARKGLWVVEDAACAFGAWYGSRHAGTMGELGCFSFHPRKSITTGEGGMVVTEGEDRDSLLRSLRDHGASRSDLVRHEGPGGFVMPDFPVLGFNYRMTDLQGAVGCAQMERAEAILSGRAQRAGNYGESLGGLDWLRLPTVPAGFVHGYQAYVGLFRPEEPTLERSLVLQGERDALMGRLEREGIATRPGTHAPVTLGYYVGKYGLRPGDFPGAVIAERLSLALPLFPQMSDEEQGRVVEALTKAYGA